MPFFTVFHRFSAFFTVFQRYPRSTVAGHTAISREAAWPHLHASRCRPRQ